MAQLTVFREFDQVGKFCVVKLCKFES